MEGENFRVDDVEAKVLVGMEKGVIPSVSKRMEGGADTLLFFFSLSRELRLFEVDCSLLMILLNLTCTTTNQHNIAMKSTEVVIAIARRTLRL